MDSISPIRGTPATSPAPALAPSQGAPAPAARRSQDTAEVSPEAKARLAAEQTAKPTAPDDATQAPAKNPLQALGV
jgi:hypothetical protein